MERTKEMVLEELEKVKEKRFYLEMKDYWDYEDQLRFDKYNQQIKELTEELNSYE